MQVLERQSSVTEAAAGRSSPERGEFLSLLVLFVSFRVLAVLFFKPGGEVYSGGHDFRFYLEMAELSLEGYYPYLDFWVEYPPLFPLALVVLYRVSLLLPSWPSPILWFQVSVSLFLVLFEAGNLCLVYLIAKRLHGPRGGIRAAWVYSALFLPLYSLTNWFDAMPLFFLLLAVQLALSRHPLASGAAVGLGFMTKLIPAVAGPASFLAWRTWRERLAYVAGAAGAVLLVSVPLLLANATMFIASFRSMMSRGSWLTPWALLEGYFDVGYMPTFAARFSAANADWQIHSQTLPWPLLYGCMLGLGLFVFTRRLRWAEPRVLVAASALTLHILLLFSKGFSPQFLLYVLAFVVVLLPGKRGIVYILALTFNSFVEWPVAGVYFRDARWLWWAVILMRTLLLALLAVEYSALLFPRLAAGWRRVERMAFVPATAVLLALGLGGAVTLASAYAAGGDLAPVAATIASGADSTHAIVATSSEAFYGLKARLPNERFVPLRAETLRDEHLLAEHLSRVTSGTDEAWLVVDHAHGDAAEREAVVRWFDGWGSRASEVWLGGYQVLNYVSYAREGMLAHGVAASFGRELRLEGWEASAGNLVPGERLRLLLAWRVVSTPGSDYKVFVHLVDGTGAPVAQVDRALSKGGRTASQLAIGELVREAYDLLVPSDLPPGAYRIVVGLYDPESGARLPLAGGGDGLPLGEWSYR